MCRCLAAWITDSSSPLDWFFGPVSNGGVSQTPVSCHTPTHDQCSLLLVHMLHHHQTRHSPVKCTRSAVCLSGRGGAHHHQHCCSISNARSSTRSLSTLYLSASDDDVLISANLSNNPIVIGEYSTRMHRVTNEGHPQLTRTTNDKRSDHHNCWRLDLPYASANLATAI